VVEVAKHLLGDWTEPATALRQPDPERAPVPGIARSTDESAALDEPDEGRHRLLAETRTGRELPHPQAVLLEEGKEDRSVGGADVAEATRLEALVQQLVPALGGLGEQVAQALTGRRHFSTVSD
jgi:hypothetical protein